MVVSGERCNTVLGGSDMDMCTEIVALVVGIASVVFDVTDLLFESGGVRGRCTSMALLLSTSAVSKEGKLSRVCLNLLHFFGSIIVGLTLCSVDLLGVLM